jgi:hypothetical protein
VRLGLALAFKGSLGADSLWWSFPLGSVATLLMSSVYYRYGGWRKQRLVVPASTAAAPTQAAAAEPVGGQHPVG